MNPNGDGDLEKRHLTSEQETAEIRKALRDEPAAAQDRHLKDELVVAGDEEDAQLMQEISELNQEMVIKMEEIDETEEAESGDETKGIDLIETPESGEASGRICRPFRCQQPGCRSSFKHKFSLTQHQNVHMAKFQCRECRRCCQSRSALQQHLKVHSSERLFACDWAGCGGTYKWEFQLQQHRKQVHSIERPFQCNKDDCGKWFKTKKTLQRHSKTHSSFRPFRCQKCQKSFNSLPKLKEHVVVHSDDWPFVCELHGCGGTFKWKHQLKQHRKQVHSIGRSFKCNENGCDKSFEDFQKHI